MSVNWVLLIRRCRWVLAFTVAVIAAALIAQVQLTSGHAHHAARYMVMGVWSIAQYAIPALVAIDLFGHLALACVRVSQRQFGEAMRIFALTIVVDSALLALAVGAGLAVLTLT